MPDSRAGLLARRAFRYSKREFGTVPDPLRVYAHHPDVLSGYSALEYATAGPTACPKGSRLLAATKAAALPGCEFCMDIGSMISSRAGITEEQLRALPDYADEPAVHRDEKLVLDLAAGMTATPVDVPDELFARLREHFDEPQLVELAAEIASRTTARASTRPSASARRASAPAPSARCRSAARPAAPPP